MKVVLITKTLEKGGAASGARNLLNALRAADAEVVELDGYAALRGRALGLARTIERALERLLYDAETHCLRLAPAVFDLREVYDKYSPDLIQICDVSGNTILFSDIGRVPCPVVHRLSDFWPYNGARHYSEFTRRPRSIADSMLHLSIFNGGEMPHCRVAPSHWLANRLSGGRVEIIRNAVDIPNGVRARRLRPGILRFGFISGHIMDARKGFPQLPGVLEEIGRNMRLKVELHIFGRLPKRSVLNFKNFEVKTHSRFRPVDLQKVYNSFDVLLCPSRRDNSPNVVTEALAYGVPVIGQLDTGMSTYISEQTGALIDFYGAEADAACDFAEAVERFMGEFQRFSHNAIDYAKMFLAPKVIGDEYVSLYEGLLR